jgi:acyl carrier protein phosphodiesterase
MNYLAHAFLAGENPDAQLGQLLGDFVKGSNYGAYAPAIAADILLHRKIDRYTDTHPVVKAAKGIVGDRQRRYLGIALDVLYDHFLAHHWHQYSDVDLDQFTQGIYALLQDRQALLPPRLQQMIPKMIAVDMLGSYREFDQCQRAIARLSQRLKHRDRLLACLPAIDEHYSFLAAGFHQFFPQLIAYVQHQRSQADEIPPGPV